MPQSIILQFCLIFIKKSIAEPAHFLFLRDYEVVHPPRQCYDERKTGIMTRRITNNEKGEATMRIETDRLVIRELESADEKSFVKMASDGSLKDIGFDRDCHMWM